MRLSSLADYAIVMMSAAARKCGATRLNATLLAADTGLPLPTVQKLVSRLSAAGLIESSRGTGGGFRLARPPVAISLADIVEAIEGPIALTACVEHRAGECKAEDTCRVKPHMGSANAAVRGALAGVSLASLTSPLPLAGGAGGGRPVATKTFARVERVPTPSPSRKREGSKMVGAS